MSALHLSTLIKRTSLNVYQADIFNCSQHPQAPGVTKSPLGGIILPGFCGMKSASRRAHGEPYVGRGYEASATPEKILSRVNARRSCIGYQHPPNGYGP